MAVIYRYEVADKILRNRTNLGEHSSAIVNTIKNYFNNALKDCFVTERYYEIKLYTVLTNYEKRKFGKILINENPKLKQILEHKKGNVNFRRMKQSYYAYLGEAEDTIELIDAMDFQNTETLVNKSKAYISSLPKESVNSIFSSSNALNISFYMDTFSLVLDEDNENFLRNAAREGNTFEIVLIEGQTTLNNNNYLIADKEAHFEYQDTDILIESFNLKKVLHVNKDKIKAIKDSLELHLKMYDEHIDIINKNILDKSINFEVHDVGQALCTSLSDVNESALLFFDFGMTNKINHRISNFIVNHPPIFLSHLHRDHWNGILVFKEAYKCEWYIPKQDLKLQFRKKCAEIIFIGGSVLLATQNINLGFGKIIPSLSDMKLHQHETGTILYLKLLDEKNTKKNILVSGDQRYSCIDNRYKVNIEILVASHHGGEYYKNKKVDNYKEIPIGSDKAIVVYSANNTPKYCHPSHKTDYIKRKWTKEHTTYLDGCFRFKK